MFKFETRSFCDKMERQNKTNVFINKQTNKLFYYYFVMFSLNLLSADVCCMADFLIFLSCCFVYFLESFAV